MLQGHWGALGYPDTGSLLESALLPQRLEHPLHSFTWGLCGDHLPVHYTDSPQPPTPGSATVHSLRGLNAVKPKSRVDIPEVGKDPGKQTPGRIHPSGSLLVGLKGEVITTSLTRPCTSWGCCWKFGGSSCQGPSVGIQQRRTGQGVSKSQPVVRRTLFQDDYVICWKAWPKAYEEFQPPQGNSRP